MAWFKWSRVLASKEKGGLGVASLFALNRALLFKWIWCFHNDKNSLWARFNGALYGICGDVWRGDSNFKSCFPRLYALETDKKISVADKLNQNEVGSTLRRLPRNGVEMDQYTALAEILEGVILPDMFDRWIWALTGSGKFSVSSSRKFIDEQSIIARVSSKQRWILEGICYVAWWLIWNYPNKFLFDFKSPPKEIIFDTLVSKSFDWCRYRSKASLNRVECRHLSPPWRSAAAVENTAVAPKKLLPPLLNILCC
nr:hypothetical protein [Tanacetum cinerariifolium]